MNWNEKALEAGEGRYINGNERIETWADQVREEAHVNMFASGAHWQRDQLRTDEGVDRVAGVLYFQDFSTPMREHSSWCTNPSCDLIDGYRVDARHLINALLGED